MKQQKSYWSVIGRPLSMWLLYLIVFAVATGVGMMKLGYVFLVGYGAVAMALLFGFWNGINSRKVLGASLYGSAFTGFVLGLIVGFINLLFIVGLSVVPISFSSLISAGGYGQGYTGIVVASLSAWLEITLMATVASVIGSEKG